MNAFKHGLASIEKRREVGVPTQHEENVRQQILQGLIADKGGDDQISTATRILAEVIASDASWLMAFNNAIDHVIQNNPKARQNPRGLSQLDGFGEHRHDISGARCAEQKTLLRFAASPPQLRDRESYVPCLPDRAKPSRHGTLSPAPESPIRGWLSDST
jgi:hypothetical protein